MTRRQFLQSGVALGVSSCLPRPVAAQGSGFRAVVVIDLNGGADNFLFSVPLDNARRNALRSRRWDITRFYDNPSSLVEVGSGIAFHPNLAPLAAHLDKTRVTMGCVNNLNLPENGSHEIAQIRAALATEIRTGKPAGWMARMFDAGVDVIGFTGTRSQNYSCESARCRSTPPLVVDSLESYRMDGVSFSSQQGGSSTARHVAAAIELMANQPAGSEAPLREAFRTAQRSMILSSDEVQDMVATYQSPLHSMYPPQTFGLGHHLRNVATVITKLKNEDSQARVIFSVPFGGFDTHQNYNSTTANLMNTFAAAVKVFLDDMTALGVLDNVVLTTVTDFGRQIASSGNGTHHGDSFTNLTIGGRVAGGVWGEMLSATQLSTAYHWPRGIDSLDSRNILFEIIDSHLGLNPVQTAFSDGIASEFTRIELGLFRA